MRAVLANAFAALALVAAGVQAADDPWPERTVGMDSMKLASQPPPLKLPIRNDSLPGKSTVALQLHVDAEGRVLQMRMQQSSGVGRVDEAVMNMARGMRFQPYHVDDVAVPVTLTLPVVVPFRQRN